MRLHLVLVVCGLVAALASPAAAQVVALHQALAPAAKAPAPAAAAPAPAKPSTIIPGSPLAALTGAAPAAPAAPADNNAPAGSGALGLSLTSLIGEETAHTVDTFTAAVERSTELTPVSHWLPTVWRLPTRRAHAAEITRGLAIAVLPALVVEFLLHLALARPRAAIAARAATRLGVATPARPAPPPPVEDGLASAEAGDSERRPHRRVSLRNWGRRLVRAVLHVLLALLPLVGFAVTAGVLLGLGLIGTRQARLAVVAVSNAYLACRLALEALRFLIAPGAPALRLIAATNARANWWQFWARLVLGTAAAAYAIVSVCEVLGLNHDGRQVLVRLFGLALHVEVAVMIWRGRRGVARWIAGRQDPPSLVTGSRRRLARIWHFLALFYVLALWIALAGGVQNAFSLLLRLVLVVLAALVVGRLAWTGSAQLLDRLFPDADTITGRRAAFTARARVYNPLVRFVIRLVILAAVAVVILQGWGIGVVHWLRHDPISRALIYAFFSIVITIAVALLVWEALNAFINNRIDHMAATGHTRRAARLRTFLPMLRTAIGVVIAIVAGLICLAKIGVNAAPLLAGAGVLGIAVAFGSQKLVQDIITGLFLLMEDAMQVGDVVSLAGMTGTVEQLSIRTIRLRGGDGSVNIIPFSAVTTVTNMTRDFGYAQITVQIGYEEDLPRVYAVLDDISHTMRAEEKWGAMMQGDLQIFGLDQFGASALVITGQIRTGPGQHWAVRREFNARVKQRFEADHIDMPYAYLAPAPPKVVAAEEAKALPPPDLAHSGAQTAGQEEPPAAGAGRPQTP